MLLEETKDLVGRGAAQMVEHELLGADVLDRDNFAAGERVVR